MGECCVRAAKEPEPKKIPVKTNKFKKSPPPESKHAVASAKTSASREMSGSRYANSSPALSSRRSSQRHSPSRRFSLRLVALRTKKLARPFHTVFDVKGEATCDAYGAVWTIENRKSGVVRLARIVEKTEETAAAIAREESSLEKLDHHNILTHFETLESEANYYFLFEAIIGGRIVPHSEIAGKQTELAIANIVIQLLQAVKFCHSKAVYLTNLVPKSVIFLETKSEGIVVKVVGVGAKRKLAGESDVSTEGFLPFFPPEAFHGSGNEKSDIWSCGALIYYLVSGQLPFPASSRDELRCELDHGTLQFALTVWGGYSLNLQRLLTGMLARDPEERLSISQCISHPWTQLFHTSDKSEAVKVALMNLQKFKAGKKMKLATMNFLALNVIPVSVKARMMKAFSVIDINSENRITSDELKSAYAKYYEDCDPSTLVSEVFSSIDSDGKGHITSSEFCLAALDQGQLLETESLQQTFDALDRESCRRIKLSELVAMMKCEGEEWTAMLGHIGKDADEEVNFEEFAQLMRLAME